MCAAVVSMQRDRSSRERVDRALNSRDNYFPGEICSQNAAVWASQQRADSATRRRTDFSRDGRPRSPTRRLPLRSGPWGCRAAVPRRERARCVSRLWTPRRSAPVFAEASGPASPRKWHAAASSKILCLCGRAAQRHRLQPTLQLSDHIAARSATRLYFAPLLLAKFIVRPLLHNQ